MKIPQVKSQVVEKKHLPSETVMAELKILWSDEIKQQCNIKFSERSSGNKPGYAMMGERESKQNDVL